jgi:5'-nucleotidase
MPPSTSSARRRDRHRPVSGDFVFGVDLDGVCGDYTAAFRAVVAADRGVPEDTLPLERSWDFGEWGIETAEEFDRLHHLAVMEHRIFRDMPAFPGAAETLWRLSDAGVWIRIITHRLFTNWGHAMAVADTVAWLDAHSIPYRDICFLGAKPEVEAHAYIDDAAHNIEALRAAGNHVIVFDAPYNRGLAGPRVHGWDAVEPLVLTHAATLGMDLRVPPDAGSAGVDRLTRRVTHRLGP